MAYEYLNQFTIRDFGLRRERPVERFTIKGDMSNLIVNRKSEIVNLEWLPSLVNELA